MQELYQSWLNEIENISDADEHTRFSDEFFINANRIVDKIDNKTFISEMYIKKATKEISKYYAQMIKIQQQNYETDETKQLVIEEQLQRNEKNEKRLEIIVFEARANVKKIRESFYRCFTEVYQQVIQVRNNLVQQYQNDDQHQGLSLTSIQRFHLFTADESLVGQQCAICLEDINVGRRMRRLTCDGQHSFCPGCCETWFANNNTCPLCRHAFV